MIDLSGLAGLTPVNMSQYRSMSSSGLGDGPTERTSFVRSKSHRKYGSTSSNMSEPSLKYQPSSFIQHRVQAGDTLPGIALRYKTTVMIPICC